MDSETHYYRFYKNCQCPFVATGLLLFSRDFRYDNVVRTSVHKRYTMKTFIDKLEFVGCVVHAGVDYTYPYEQYHTSVDTEELVSLYI